MPISIVCSFCDARIRAADSFAGKTARCPKCKGRIAVPMSIEEAAATNGDGTDETMVSDQDNRGDAATVPMVQNCAEEAVTCPLCHHDIKLREGDYKRRSLMCKCGERVPLELRPQSPLPMEPPAPVTMAPTRSWPAGPMTREQKAVVAVAGAGCLVLLFVVMGIMSDQTARRNTSSYSSPTVSTATPVHITTSSPEAELREVAQRGQREAVAAAGPNYTFIDARVEVIPSTSLSCSHVGRIVSD